MEKDINKAIGQRIKDSRELAGLTQEKLAKSVGITDKFLSTLERGVNGPSISTLIEISKTLSVSCDYILCGEENNPDALLFDRIKHLNSDNKQVINELVNSLLAIQNKNQ